MPTFEFQHHQLAAILSHDREIYKFFTGRDMRWPGANDIITHHDDGGFSWRTADGTEHYVKDDSCCQNRTGNSEDRIHVFGGTLPAGAFEPKKKSILQEAEEIINGDRAKAYGHPTPNHQAIANLWQAYLDNRQVLGIDGDLTPSDAALMMVLLKIARLQYLPGHRDSVVDGAGYFGCLERIVLED